MDDFEDSEKRPLLGSLETYVASEEKGILSKKAKVSYAAGGIPYPMTANVVAFFISVFLLDVAEIRPAYVSIIVFSGKAWDAITDPTIGILIQKFDSRFGKIKPWIVLSTPFAVVSYFFLWYVPDISDNAKLGYYFVIYCSYQTFLTCYHLPYSALTMYLSDQQSDRDSATAYRMTCEVLGTVIGIVVHALCLTAASSIDFLDPCIDTNSTDVPTYSPEERDPVEQSYMLSAGILSILFIISCMIVTIGTSEKKDDAVDQQKEREEFCGSLKDVFTHGPYILLLLCFLCVSLSLQIVQGNLALYLLHAIQYENYQLALMLLLISTLICLPVWQLIMNKIGKKKTLGIGMIIEIPILGSLYFANSHPAAIYTLSIVSGAAISVAYLCPWSMIPDVIDDFTVKTGTRKEAIFYSFYVFFTKLAVGVTLGISALVLEFVGYNSGACTQPEAVAEALRILVSAGPVFFLLIGLVFLWFYPITEMRRSETRTKLAEIRERKRSSLTLAASASLLSKSAVPVGKEPDIDNDNPLHSGDKSPSSVKFVISEEFEGEENDSTI
ncbi:sodium-dependent lysophosphatidylcholine symporter 1-B-like [Glandiceps talaboti]